MELYILTDDECYLKVPKDISHENPFSFKAQGGAWNIWYVYPSAVDISLHVNVKVNGKYVWVYTDGAGPSPMCGKVTTPETPQLAKPSELITFLAQPLLNFDIFTWHLGIGEWIEKAIDWVVEKINGIITWVTTIWNKVNAAWDKAVEVGQLIPSLINQAVKGIQNFISSVPTLIQNGVNAIKPWIQSMVESAISTVSNVINWLENTVNSIRAKWDSFAQNILPGLVGAIPIVGDLIKKVQSLIDTVGNIGPFLEELRQFWNDPEKWVLDKICNMLARFI